MWKWIKFGGLGIGGLTLVGLLAFGSDLFSYVSSSARSMRTAVKDAVPMDFELRRARDLLDQIIPEMQGNVRLIAQEEVEVANLKTDIQQCDASMGTEKARIQKISGLLETQQTSYSLGGRTYGREQIKEDLAGRFDRFKEAQQVLEGKRHLLTAREKSLQAAVVALDKTRATKTTLESKIASLEGQYRLVQAASATSNFKVDNSKLAQTEKLIADIKKRLDVAQRVLAHEAAFVETLPADEISDKDLVAQVKEYFGQAPAVADAAMAEKSAGPAVAAAKETGQPAEVTP